MIVNMEDFWNRPLIMNSLLNTFFFVYETIDKLKSRTLRVIIKSVRLFTYLVYDDVYVLKNKNLKWKLSNGLSRNRETITAKMHRYPRESKTR